MTYPRALLGLVLPAIGLLAALAARKGRLTKSFFASLAVLLVVVYLATIPWDNLAVKWGVWSFDWSKTSGVRFAYLPLEEYLFFGLETVLVALAWALLRRRSGVAGELG